jgi:hypothetical protein
MSFVTPGLLPSTVNRPSVTIARDIASA